TFSEYLLDRTDTIIYSDSQFTCNVLKNKAIVNRITRWAVRIQPYTFTVKHLEGVKNYIADYLSRYPDVITTHEFKMFNDTLNNNDTQNEPNKIHLIQQTSSLHFIAPKCLKCIEYNNLTRCEFRNIPTEISNKSLKNLI